MIKVKYCTGCGKLLDNSNFCTHCGKKQTGSDTGKKAAALNVIFYIGWIAFILCGILYSGISIKESQIFFKSGSESLWINILYLSVSLIPMIFILLLLIPKSIHTKCRMLVIFSIICIINQILMIVVEKILITFIKNDIINAFSNAICNIFVPYTGVILFLLIVTVFSGLMYSKKFISKT